MMVMTDKGSVTGMMTEGVMDRPVIMVGEMIKYLIITGMEGPRSNKKVHSVYLFKKMVTLSFWVVDVENCLKKVDFVKLF